VIEVEVLRAAAHGGAGEEDAALTALGHAVDLAEADGWVRVFVDAGPLLTPLLRALADRRPASAFVRRLQAEAEPARDDLPRSAPAPTTAALVDPLSDRELDVLRLLASELDGPAIARELVVSLNTVRTHTKHIYTKLDVNNRRSAVTRAHQLGLLSRSATR
jgi:LuxR family maltose regulon positive regulatory protein